MMMAVAFSILGRIGGDATNHQAGAGRIHARHFQYPRSDRRRCNVFGDSAANGVTKHFQYPRSDRRRCNNSNPTSGYVIQATFSILGRIGGDATGRADWDGRRHPPTFSILGRIGGDATCVRYVTLRGELFFQYPRSDRRRCNASPSPSPGPRPSTFSILGRIGGDATVFEEAHRGRWNVLSVSSVGSEAMQLQEIEEARAELELSVSSVGSEAMQPPPPPHSPPPPSSPFSILGRIGGDATHSAIVHLLSG